MQNGTKITFLIFLQSPSYGDLYWASQRVLEEKECDEWARWSWKGSPLVVVDVVVVVVVVGNVFISFPMKVFEKPCETRLENKYRTVVMDWVLLGIVDALVVVVVVQWSWNSFSLFFMFLFFRLPSFSRYMKSCETKLENKYRGLWIGFLWDCCCSSSSWKCISNVNKEIEKLFWKPKF